MLDINEISYRYSRGPWLFKNVNISIQPGEVVGLSGFSGSGKTTLAKIIGGYLTPHTGSIRIAGHAANKNTGAHPIQLVWQHPEKAINPKWKMKVIKNESGSLNEGLIEKFGIKTEWMDRRPHELSGGELQRFCIARALAGTTKYLIADEMTTMLDAITQAQIWHAVLDIANQRQIGILAISHDMQLLNKISDRIIRFNDITNVS